jgi:putative zinc finger/helix-turn-helix YgiT family protein
MKENQRIVEFPSHPLIRCPHCESEKVKTTTERQVFTYGEKDKATELEAYVSVRSCTNCGFQFTDGEAEDARHDAVCRHLKVLTPKEIVELRKRYEMSRAEFAELTRLGEASLARWENGLLIQNGGNDQLLYLLTLPSNVKFLQHRVAPSARPTVTTTREPQDRRFRALTNADAFREEAASFRLTGCVASAN